MANYLMKFATHNEKTANYLKHWGNYLKQRGSSQIAHSRSNNSAKYKAVWKNIHDKMQYGNVQLTQYRTSNRVDYLIKSYKVKSGNGVTL